MKTYSKTSEHLRVAMRKKRDKHRFDRSARSFIAEQTRRDQKLALLSFRGERTFAESK